MRENRIWMAQFGWITFAIGIALIKFAPDFAMVWLGSLALTGLVTGITLKHGDANVATGEGVKE